MCLLGNACRQSHRWKNALVRSCFTPSSPHLALFMPPPPPCFTAPPLHRCRGTNFCERHPLGDPQPELVEAPLNCSRAVLSNITFALHAAAAAAAAAAGQGGQGAGGAPGPNAALASIFLQLAEKYKGALLQGFKGSMAPQP